MEKIPTAEEFFLNSYFSDSISQEDKELWLECNNQAKESIKIMKEFAKMHVEVALKAASEEAFAISTHSSISSRIKLICENSGIVSVNRDSILNSYSLDNIK